MSLEPKLPKFGLGVTCMRVYEKNKCYTMRHTSPVCQKTLVDAFSSNLVAGVDSPSWQTLRKSVQGFWLYRGSEFALLHGKATLPLQLLRYPYACLSCLTATRCKWPVHFRVPVVTATTFTNSCCSKTHNGWTFWYRRTGYPVALAAERTSIEDTPRVPSYYFK